MLPKQTDAEDNTVLAVRETFYAVIACGAKRLAAAVTADGRRIMAVIGTIH
jgi:hypothetical protein